MMIVPPVRGVSRLLWLLAGIALFVLGAIGVVLPVLPTMVFWLGAVACFARSHPPMAARMLSHPLFGLALRRFHEHGVIDARGKRAALLALAVSGFATVVMSRSLLVSAGVCGSLGVVALYIVTRPQVVPIVNDTPGAAKPSEP